MKKIWISLIVILIIMNCMTATRRFDQKTETQTTIRVVNQSWRDMKIYIIYGSQKQILGRVDSISEKSFPVPDYMIDTVPLQIMADPVGAESGSISQQIMVRPGHEIVFRINK